MMLLAMLMAVCDASSCNGADSGCTNIQQGDGDCDYDSDCAGDLVCGSNNCVGTQFDGADDCCMVASLLMTEHPVRKTLLPDQKQARPCPALST